MIISFIILFRDCSNAYRVDNLHYVLTWITRTLQESGLSYEIIISEQDENPKFTNTHNIPNLKHIFLYNPQEFNRGWGFNCAIQSCQGEVLVLGDADLILVPKYALVDAIKACHVGKYQVVSPYMHVFKTDEQEREQIIKSDTINLNNLTNKNFNSFFTVGGGLSMVKKETYLKIGGFEEHDGWGLEDRGFDVTLERYLDQNQIKTLPYIAIHLYHPLNNDRRDWKTLKHRMLINSSTYGCPEIEYTVQYCNRVHQPLKHYNSPHRFCNHILDKESVIIPVHKRFNLKKYEVLIVAFGNLKKVPDSQKQYDILVAYPNQNFEETNQVKYCLFNDSNNSFDKLIQSKSIKTIYLNKITEDHHLCRVYPEQRNQRKTILNLAKDLKYKEVYIYKNNSGKAKKISLK